MAATYGINVTQNGSDFPEACGPWVRLVVSDDRAWNILMGYRAQGYRTIAVATRQVILNLGNSTADTPRRFFDLFGASEAVQVWNEPDGGGSESDVADRNTYQAWLWAFRDEVRRRGWPGILLAAGLVSGDPRYLDGLDMTGGYRLALHPYDQRPSAGYPDWGHGDIPSLLDAYRPYLPPGTKFWLTECSRTTQDEGLQARYATALVESIATRDDVDAALWYCWKDWHLGSVPRPFGLTREDGGRKATYHAYTAAVAAAGGGSNVNVKDINAAQAEVYKLASPAAVFNPDAAIAKYWLKLKQNGRFIGVPIGEEMTFPANEPEGRKAAQGFTGGVLLVWRGGEDVRVE